MVKHIVCYKFKDNSRENLDRATEALVCHALFLSVIVPEKGELI